MFEVLIREAAARFGLDDKALPLIQMLLAHMNDKETGGLAGFLEQFKAAGCGPIIQSWLGGGPAAQPINNSQLEAALGADGGLLSLATERLGLPRDSITSALGYLLPTIVGKLTLGGSIPSGLPPEIASLASVGQSLLAAAPAQLEAVKSGGGLGKWLPWIVIAAVVLIALGYYAKTHTTDAPAAAPVASAPAPAQAAPAQAPASPTQPASQPEADASAPKASFGGS